MSQDFDAHAAEGFRAEPRGLRATTRGGIGTYGWVLALTLGLSLLDVLPTLDRRWFPWDEGTLGQSAQRVLNGELPHRDFVDAYTGGLAFFDAGVFWLFGTDLLWLRLAMLPLFVAFVVSVFYIAGRFVPPLGAGLVTLICVLWTVPNYPAAMPSWFNLFLATVGAAAIVRSLEHHDRRWLVAAGIAGGASIVIKVVGVYFVMAAVLFLLFKRRFHAEAPGKDERRAASFLTGGFATLSFFVVLAIVWQELTPAVLVAFVLPVAAVTAGVVLVEALSGGDPADLARAALVDTASFLVGVSIPVACFLVPYVATGSLGNLISDIAAAPGKRFEFASFEPLSVRWLAVALPLVVAAAVPALRGRARTIAVAGVAALALGASVIPSAESATRLFVNPARELTPIVAIAGSVIIVQTALRRRSSPGRIELMALLVFVAAFGSLVQFPFAAPIYFFYAFPLIALAALAVLFELDLARGPVIAAIGVAYLIVGSFHLQQSGRTLAQALVGSHPGLSILDERRGRIYVPSDQAAIYRRITVLLRSHARGRFTVAGPDAPEIPFLAGLENPTPQLFDFLSSEADRDRSVLGAVRRDRIAAVVVNQDPSFSPQYGPRLLGRLERFFPHHEVVGHFDVRWRA